VSAYVPILAAERSRLAGLAATTDAVKNRLTPLFDVAALAPAAGNALPEPGGADLERALAEVVDAVAAAFGRRRAYLDCEAVDQRWVDDGRLVAAWLLDEARTRGLALVPVTGLRRSDAHQLAASDAASVDGRGVCLRLQLPDFADLDTLPERVHALVDALGVVPDQVDLLVDLGRVAAAESPVLAVAARAVLSPLRRAARWRNVALAAAGCAQPRAPRRAGGARRAAEVDRVPRTEWLLWRALAADAPALGFGDYAGLGGEGSSAPRPTSPADACGEWLGYARDAEWLVVRADAAADAAVRDCADAPPPLAALATRPEFYGVAHCAGDAGLVAVRDADARTPASSRDATLVAWRAAAVTHHLTVTVEGIARAEQHDG
jgi:hypothetical protein